MTLLILVKVLMGGEKGSLDGGKSTWTLEDAALLMQ